MGQLPSDNPLFKLKSKNQTVSRSSHTMEIIHEMETTPFPLTKV